MDLKEIKKLIQIVEEANISEFSVESDGLKYEVKKVLGGANATHLVQHSNFQEIPAQAVGNIQQAADVSTVAAPESNAHLIEVKAQMVGTFYDAPNPESEAYVKVGDRISSGNVICIIEAMKLFNEIEADDSGVIEEICVKTGDPIEYGQVLYRLSK